MVESLLYGAAILACPVGMGAMMWLMMRSGDKAAPAHTDAEVAQLRAEVEQLQAQRAGR